MNQPNDLAITAEGMLFASDPDWSAGTGTRWRLDPDGGVSVPEADMGTSNGVEVSPEERRLGINQTVQRNGWADDRSPRGALSNKRLVIQCDDDGLEGMRCDVAGNLSVTRWGKGTVVKLTPTDELRHEIARGRQALHQSHLRRTRRPNL
jgi:sugar lactone lactonase YvrE